MRLAWPLVGLLLLGAGCRDNNPASDVRGNYALTFDDRLKLKLRIGGAVREAEGSESDVVTFEGGGQPFTLDLSEFCGREEVQCPSETLWDQVAIDQPNIQAQNPDSHVINVIDNRVRDLPDGQQAAVVSGLVNAQDRFGLILGAGSQGEGTDCGLLGLSTSEGRFTHEGEEEVECEVGDDAGDADAGSDDAGEAAPCTRITWPDGAAVNGIAEGKVKLGFLAACAFGPALVGASLEIETGYTGTRTGDFDPPPFTPLDPEDVPPGISDAGPLADLDAGAADAGPADAG